MSPRAQELASPPCAAHDARTGHKRIVAAARTSTGLAVLSMLLALAGCGDVLQPEYDIQLLRPVGQDPLAGGTQVTLEAVGTGLKSEQLIAAGANPAFKIRGLNPRTTSATSFSVTVTDAAGTVIAFGRSPRIRLLEGQVSLRILVQRLGTLAQPFEQPIVQRLAEGNVVTALVRDPGDTQTPGTLVPVFLGGRSLNDMRQELPNRPVVAYNPYLQTTVFPALATRTATGAAVWARADGSLWFFGGRVEGPPLSLSGDTDQIGTSQFLNVIDLGIVARYAASTPALAREGGVITEVPSALGGVMYVFGGQTLAPPAGEPTAPPTFVPIASVVKIEPAASAPGQVVLPAPFSMLAPRVGHTATTVSVPALGANGLVTERSDVLLFGGAAAGLPVAELLDGNTNTFVPLGVDAGPPRRDHTVVRLPDGRLLILGGIDTAGQPLADARIFDPLTRTFTPVALPLQTPRVGAAIAAVGQDLLVGGGQDAGKGLVPTAEVFDLATLSLVTTLPALPRVGARVASMPDGSLLLLGGRALEGELLLPSDAVEIYRPRALPAL